MKLKIRVKPDVTKAQKEELSRLGCETEPFITTQAYMLLAATCTKEQSEAIEKLKYVLQVEPMPTYRAC